MAEKFENLILTLNRLTGKKYPEIEKIIQNAINELDIPLLTDFFHLLDDFKNILYNMDQDIKNKNKNKKYLMLFQKFNDLQYLDHLMVIHNSGIAIYNYSFTEKYFDPQLISGFLTAILSFQESTMIKSEISSKVISQSSFELLYANFIILLNSSKYFKVALIMEKKPSNSIRKSLFEFISRFQNKYDKLIQDYSGNVEVFKDVDKLVEEIFSVSLGWPHRIKSEINIKKIEKNLTNLQNLILNVINDLQEETEYFLISNIIEIIKKQKNIPEDKIFSAFCELDQKGLFLKFPPEKMVETLEKEKEKISIKEIDASLDDKIEIISSIEGVPKKLIEKINNHLVKTSYIYQKMIIENIISIPKKEKNKFLKDKYNKWTELEKQKKFIANKLAKYEKNNNNNINISEKINYLVEYKELCEELGYEEEADIISENIYESLNFLKNSNLNEYKNFLNQFNKLLSKYIENAEFDIINKKVLNGAFNYNKAVRIAKQIGNIEMANTLSKIVLGIEK